MGVLWGRVVCGVELESWRVELGAALGGRCCRREVTPGYIDQQGLVSKQWQQRSFPVLPTSTVSLRWMSQVITLEQLSHASVFRGLQGEQVPDFRQAPNSSKETAASISISLLPVFYRLIVLSCLTFIWETTCEHSVSATVELHSSYLVPGIFLSFSFPCNVPFPAIIWLF